MGVLNKESEARKELSRFESSVPVYHEDKDTEIAGVKDVGKGIRNCAEKLLKEWEALEP